MNKTSFGKYGEDLAVTFLKKQGYVILDRNFRIRGGEIDIIAIDRNVLAYVEVKTRSTHQFGSPQESVTHSKLRFIDLCSAKVQIELIKNAGF